MHRTCDHVEAEPRPDTVGDLGPIAPDTESRFDRLAELAAALIGVPIALISFVGRDCQLVKSRVGWENAETGPDVGLYAHTLLADDGGDGPFVVEDTLLDERFADNPLVTGHPHVRFCAAVVLRDRDGSAVGTLAVMDRRPRELDDGQRRALGHLADLAEEEIQRDIATASRTVDVLPPAVDIGSSSIPGFLTEGVVLGDSDGRVRQWNLAAEQLLGLSGDEFGRGARFLDDPRWGAIRTDGSIWPGEAHPSMDVLRTGRPVHNAVMGVLTGAGKRIWLEINAYPVLDEHDKPVQVVTMFVDVTAEIEESGHERALAAALRRSEEAARVSLDALEQGVILADTAGKILRINPAAERILGFTAAELTELWTGSSWETYDESGLVIAPDRRPLARAAASGQPVIGEVVGWRRRDGSRILVRVSCIPIVDSGGLVIAFTDITDEHLARRLLDATLETAPVGLVIFDENRSIMRCNPTFAQQAGRSVEDLVGTDVMNLVHPSDRPAATVVGQVVRSGAQAGALDQRVVRPDGSEIWVNTHLAVLTHANRPVAVAATFDVTEHRRMLLELSRFAHLFRNANDIITVVDRSGRVLYASPSSERVLGYPDGYKHPDGILGLVHPEDLDCAAGELAALIAGTRGPEPFTVRVTSFSGEWRYIECVGVNLLDEPDVAAIVITARDTTERVRLAEQLAHRAGHDTLTDLPNRHLLESRLDQALARSEREENHVGLCFIDLNGFKNINDTLGHAAGDAVLVAVADRLRETIRAGDTAARVGGDEFVIILDPVTGPGQALAVANRIRDAIADLPHSALNAAKCGASIGLATSQQGDTSSGLLNRADAAMYRAKAHHKFSIEVAVDNECEGRQRPPLARRRELRG